MSLSGTSASRVSLENVIFQGVTAHDWVPLSVNTENSALPWVKIHIPLFLPFGKHYQVVL